MNPTKPTVLKILEGYPGRQKPNENEPKPLQVTPECPDWLEDEAKKEWFRVVPELSRLKMLTILDVSGLIGYCQSWARYVEAEKYLSDNDSVTITESGYMQQVPQVAIAQKYLKLCQSFMLQFGMTPSSRGNMNVPGTPDDDEREQFFRAGKPK